MVTKEKRITHTHKTLMDTNLMIILIKVTNTKVILPLSIGINEKKKMMIGEMNFEKNKKNKVSNDKKNETEKVKSEMING
jgi:hypothetical protein